MKFSMIKVLLLAAAVAIVTVGCGKTPKLNLADLGNAGNGSAANGAGNFDGDGFAAADQPVLQDGNAGGWSSMDAPVAGGSQENAFLKNAEPWGKKVYFEYNRSDIRPDQRAVLDELAQVLGSNSKAVVIEGHCDERGSDEYNRSLSERRALAIRDYLSTIGIAMDRMFTISYGEDRPDVPNASSEAEHAKNRRGQFLLGEKK